jgi:toxin-antitoxin system PIN domain toxin
VVLPDVNVLVHAHREDADRHAPMRAWLEKALSGPGPVGVADLVLSGFVRVVTHPRVFRAPTPLARALDFAESVRSSPASVRVEPGEGHWEIFRDLCRSANAKGNLVPDAYLAALAIECGGEWITTDRDFARFPGLRWRIP